MTRLPGPRTPIGHLVWGLRLLRRPHRTLLTLYERYGSVLQVGLGPLRFVYLLGRDANELVLSTRAKDFTWREALASLIPVDGDTALVVSDGEDHARRRRLVQPAFSIRRIHGYSPLIVEEVARLTEAWHPGDQVDLYQQVRAAVRRIAIRTLFGDELGSRAGELGDHLETAIAFANIPPLPGRNLNLPGLPYRRAMRSRARADGIVFEAISRRRAGGDDRGDLLSALLAAQDADGSVLDDQEVRDQVVSLIVGGYETTSALVAWAFYATLRDPTIEDALRAELAAALGGGRADADKLDDCVYLQAVIQETLRLHSPAGFSGRKAQADIDFEGHTIKAGTLVVYSQYVTHRLPELWPDPLAFRPERWIGPDGRNVEPAPYAFVPFGGGYRRCIGFAMATLEAKLILAAVLRRTTMRLDRRDIDGRGLATVVPSGGVPVTILASASGGGELAGPQPSSCSG